MKLRHISSSLFLFALTPLAFANSTYVGVFGGYGSSNHINVSQYGTAFFTEAEGGPLEVHAFGDLNSQNAAFYGLQLGYQAQEIPLHSQWTLVPGVELEGYTLNKRQFEGNLTNNIGRLPEHDFAVTYPLRSTVFLGNAVFSFNHPCVFVHPYLIFGIGSAIVRASGAEAAQINPPEAGINHYNSHPSDSNSAFAGQFKLGLSYDINDCLSIFADYRWLYLASTELLFGPTDYLNHVPTSSWQVKLDAQRYNLGNVGVRFNW